MVSCLRFRSTRPELFCKKRFLRNFTKSAWKHLCQRLFFKKKESLAQSFSCEFSEISKNAFFYRTPPVAGSEGSNHFFFSDVRNECELQFPIYWCKDYSSHSYSSEATSLENSGNAQWNGGSLAVLLKNNHRGGPIYLENRRGALIW